MIFVDDDSRINNIHNMSVTCENIFFISDNTFEYEVKVKEDKLLNK